MTDTDRGVLLTERIRRVRERIDEAAGRCRRAPAEIKLVAVSKTHSVAAIQTAINAGLTEFGENRVQEAEQKIPLVGRESARWHLIGHLQSNKARRAVELFDVIHSLDSVALAQRLDRICHEVNRESLPVLIQVDLGHEVSKSGVDAGSVPELIKEIQRCSKLQLTGLMILPPFFDELERVCKDDHNRVVAGVRSSEQRNLLLRRQRGDCHRA